MDMTKDKLQNGRYFYGYHIVIASILILAVMHGLSSSYGIFFNSLQAEFGWNRAVTSGAHSIGFFFSGVGALIYGKLSDRIGPRRILTIGAIFFSLGYVLLSRIMEAWQLYLFYVLLVMMWPAAANVLLLSTTTRWFVKKRGFFSGIAKIGTGLGMMILPLVASSLISDHGWRSAYLVLGIVAIVFLLPITQVLRRDPAEKGLRPYGEDEAHAVSLDTADYSQAEAMKTKQFWMTGAMFMLIWYCSNSLIIHLAPFALDSGVSPIHAAALLSIIGGVSIVGRVVMAAAADRIGCRRAMTITFTLLMITLSWLYTASDLWQLRLFAVVYGFAHGGFYGLISPLVAELFGTRAHGALFGLITFCGMLGGAFGPFIAGHIFDVTQSYLPAFQILIVLSIAGFVLSILLKATRLSTT